jgi:hypothetical protein
MNYALKLIPLKGLFKELHFKVFFDINIRYEIDCYRKNERRGYSGTVNLSF